MTPQARHTIWLATSDRVHPKEIRETEVRFVHLQEDKFFGAEDVDWLGETVRVSDLHKTVLDCVDKAEYAGGIGEVARIVAGAGGQVDWKAMIRYSGRMGSQALVQRLGYLMDFVGAAMPDRARSELHGLVSPNSRPQLGVPSRWGTSGEMDPEWRLVVNVPEVALTAEYSRGGAWQELLTRSALAEP